MIRLRVSQAAVLVWMCSLAASLHGQNAGTNQKQSRPAAKSDNLKILTDEEAQSQLNSYHSFVSDLGSGDQKVLAGNGNLRPMIQYQANPVYSREALKAHLEGIVKVRATVNEQGMAEGIQVVDSPDSTLSAKAIDALNKWRWRPGFQNGRKVKYDAMIEFTFKIAGNSPDTTSIHTSYSLPAFYEKNAPAVASTAEQGSQIGQPKTDLQQAAADLTGQAASRPMVRRRLAQKLNEDERPPIVDIQVDPSCTAAELRAANIEEGLRFSAKVDETGVVEEVRLENDSNTPLGQRAIAAIKRWRFRPAQKNGNPVAALYEGTVEFHVTAHSRGQ